jgi:glycosyltransferase involved in cell wall biosynthesis
VCEYLALAKNIRLKAFGVMMKKYSSLQIKNFICDYQENISGNSLSSAILPKISIITPSYNQAEYLERTILSVINQNYSNLEYIIIDGGSSDESIDIIKKYEKHISYWVSEMDNGQTDAINKGFRIANGEIIAWQNSDDVYLPNALNTIASAFITNPNVDLVFGNRYNIDKFDNILRDMRYVPFNYNALIYEGSALCNQTAFWRTSVFKKVGYLNEDMNFCMDYDFWVRTAKCATFLFVREYIGCFRYHKKSKTSNLISLWQSEHLEILKREGIIPNRVKQATSLLRRFILLILQGDIGYIVRGILSRINGDGLMLGEKWFYDK